MILTIETYLLEIQKPDVLYHAASQLTKTLIPRISPIGSTDKMKRGYSVKGWEKKAVFAATTKDMCYPFGLERHNIMWPGTRTQEEVESWKSACYLSASAGKGKLVMCYYNFTPKKPVYLYTVDSKDFRKIYDSLAGIVEQWAAIKEVTPLKVDKVMPNKIKHSWIKVGDKEWKIKKQKYKVKGYYKEDYEN